MVAGCTIAWKVAKKYQDILYHKAGGIAYITINRPEKRNAFRPQTVFEMRAALLDGCARIRRLAWC